jgi:hypothetical protein
MDEDKPKYSHLLWDVVILLIYAGWQTNQKVAKMPERREDMTIESVTRVVEQRYPN